MLRTADWTYLDLEKTGCSFLTRKLRRICKGASFLKEKKHSRPKVVDSVPKILTIRQPFLWYFSLWSYGLDGYGKFFRSFTKLHPKVARLAYGSKTKDSFSYFLDFTLSHNLITPASKQDTRLPFSCDVYTSRILTMLVPAEKLPEFNGRISGNLSYNSIAKALSPFMPEVVIRTSTLNNDFYAYANSGQLNFLNLKPEWQQEFPLESEQVNVSSLSSSNTSLDKVQDYCSDYHRSLLAEKSHTASYLLDQAQVKIASFSS
jgi:hypothetical protein